MEIKDVVTINSFDNYLKERNFRLNSFEEFIICDFWPFLYDFQLFFILRNDRFPMDFELLRKHFYDKIEGKYSVSYPPGIVKVNEQGDIWSRVPEIRWKGVPFPNNAGFFDWIPEYYDVWKKFPEMFRLGRDFFLLYQDEDIQIITFLLKLQKQKEDYPTSDHYFYRNGYYPNPDHSCDIIKVRDFENYSYVSQTVSETIEMMSYNEYIYREPYYKEQYKELKQKLRSRRIP